MASVKEIGDILESVKKLAVDYNRLTGKYLSISGEYGEYFAAKNLELNLVDDKKLGYDATNEAGTRIHIKSQVISADKELSGQRLGSILFDREWDSIMVVVMNEAFEPYAIYEAGREAIEQSVKKGGGKSRNARSTLSAGQFKEISTLVWPAA